MLKTIFIFRTWTPKVLSSRSSFPGLTYIPIHDIIFRYKNLKAISPQIFSIFDDFSKFRSTYSAVHSTLKNQTMLKNLGKNVFEIFIDYMICLYYLHTKVQEIN